MKKLWYVLGAVGGFAVLVFGYWTISPFFRNIAADEPLPMKAQSTLGTEEASSMGKMPESGVLSEGTEMPQPAPAPSVSAMIMDTPAHPASGTVTVIEADGKTYIRYENLKTINGPDLYVYLSKDLDAKEFVSLGRIKATEGNVNYAVPTGVNVSEYRYVIIWCKAFSVLFNYADLKV